MFFFFPFFIYLINQLCCAGIDVSNIAKHAFSSEHIANFEL